MKTHLARIIAISKKELLHIIRDPRTLIIIVLMPVIQLIMFGYAMNLEIQRVDMAVIDHDRSRTAMDLQEAFRQNGFFNQFPDEGKSADAETMFLERRARVILMIPADFGKHLQREPLVPVQLLIDAADPNAAVNIQNYCNQVIRIFNERYGSALALPFEIESTIWFNPDMKSAYFFVPGILALLLVMISALLTSITIAREKEMGTMEQILVSPVRPYEIILGKVIPYAVLAFLDGALILFLGMVFFQVPFIGSALLLAALVLLFVITALSLGLLISTVTSTQQIAMMVALFATLLPTLLLSGFIFPIPSMPRILQLLSYVVPAKYFLVIVRGIMLKGNTLTQLLVPAGFLALLTAVLLAGAWKKFRVNLE